MINHLNPKIISLFMGRTRETNPSVRYIHYPCRRLGPPSATLSLSTAHASGAFFHNPQMSCHALLPGRRSLVGFPLRATFRQPIALTRWPPLPHLLCMLLLVLAHPISHYAHRVSAVAPPVGHCRCSIPPPQLGQPPPDNIAADQLTF
jgi:hypothetical protein